MSINLVGNWTRGLAYDTHTLNSTYIGLNEYGHDQWENERSEMGELVYRLKYRNDQAVVRQIVELVARPREATALDCIIPVPATVPRHFQPVPEIAKALGMRLSVPVLLNVLGKRPGAPQLKNVEGFSKRVQVLRESLVLENTASVRGKKVLLIDDVYRSGATLAVATDLLLKSSAAKVFVLALTKARSKR